jgi:bifunctional non-homologous end joining protein LigD
VLAASRAHSQEGVVGKPLASACHPGQREGWIKVTNIRPAEVVVGGWKPGQVGRADTIGSLLLGVPDGGQLRYAGHTGTGFTQAMLTDLARRRRVLRRAASPFASTLPDGHARRAQWVQSRLTGEAAVTEWTAELVLRHPAGTSCAPARTPPTSARTAELSQPSSAWRRTLAGPHASPTPG